MCSVLSQSFTPFEISILAVEVKPQARLIGDVGQICGLSGSYYAAQPGTEDSGLVVRLAIGKFHSWFRFDFLRVSSASF